MKTHTRKYARFLPNFFFLLLAIVGFSRSANATTPPGPAKSEAIAFARRMGIGWNLGNTLDTTGDWIKGSSVRDYETAWGNPVTTKAMIDGIKATGFKSLRIPVAWSNMMGPHYVINKE